VNGRAEAEKGSAILAAAVAGSSLASAERSGRREDCLLCRVAAGERTARASTATPAVPGVVLGVADGIVRIVVRAGDDPGGGP
jgi:hypothetical protein